MTSSSNSLVRFGLVLAGAICAGTAAHADGLADLKAALARLQAQTPVKAALVVKTTQHHGEGADADDRNGEASVSLEDGARGLQVAYAKDLLARMEAESRLKGRDSNARTPTLYALDQMNAADYLPLLSSAGALEHEMDGAQFIGEKADAWQGKPARLLSFSIPMSRVPQSQRQYVKKFDGTFEVWIGADGTPLASSSHENGSGSAYVVITFEWHEQNDCTYALVGDRLLTLRKEMHVTTKGAGDRGDTRVVKTLQLGS